MFFKEDFAYELIGLEEVTDVPWVPRNLLW